MKNGNIIELSGRIFNELKVIKFVETRGKYNRAYWLCKCSCGEELVVSGTSLRVGSTKSCGHLSKIRLKKFNRERRDLVFESYNGSAGAKDVYRTYKYGAKKRNLDFDLSFDDALNLFKSNCFYCGIEPHRIRDRYYFVEDGFIYNGIDRKDPKLGYFIKNCVACCWDCNKSKSDKNLNEFFDYIFRLCTYQFGDYFDA